MKFLKVILLFTGVNMNGMITKIVSPNIKALKVDPNKLILKNKLLLNYNIINTLYKINFIEKQYLNKFLDAVLEIKLNYKSNTKLYPYVLHSSLPYDLNGYATRSHNILKNFNKIYWTKNILF